MEVLEKKNKSSQGSSWGLNQDLLTKYYIDALFSSCFLPMQSLITVEMKAYLTFQDDHS